MNYCIECGSKFVEGALFCGECGAPRAPLNAPAHTTDTPGPAVAQAEPVLTPNPGGPTSVRIPDQPVPPARQPPEHEVDRPSALQHGPGPQPGATSEPSSEPFSTSSPDPASVDAEIEAGLRRMARLLRGAPQGYLIHARQAYHDNRDAVVGAVGHDGVRIAGLVTDSSRLALLVVTSTATILVTCKSTLGRRARIQRLSRAEMYGVSSGATEHHLLVHLMRDTKPLSSAFAFGLPLGQYRLQDALLDFINGDDDINQPGAASVEEGRAFAAATLTNRSPTAEEMKDLVSSATVFACQELDRGAGVDSSTILVFSEQRLDPQKVVLDSVSRAEVVEAAARYFPSARRVLALTGGGVHDGANAVFADLYDFKIGGSVAIAVHWRTKRNGKRERLGLLGKPTSLGSASMP